MNRRAFTLLEMLLAVMLMAMVLAVIYGAVWAGVKGRESLAGETDALCRINAAIDVIQADLQRISNSRTALRIMPLAAGGVIMEISAMPQSDDDTPQKIYVFLMPRSGDVTGKLIRHVEDDSDFADACRAAQTGETILTSAATSTANENFEILLDDVETFRLRCNDGSWIENLYNNRPTLPAIVEITLSTKTSKGKLISVTRCVAIPVQAGPLAIAT
ncbi:MAG TPA: prepilin-type N-terminal cleavage/methylation domain-containing protein, partial [Phycisphaerae bacterium]|nr:prepilin-type N-terminal cleavage/methylation domain-containing protein [Phycisphaerae bacterium]